MTKTISRDQIEYYRGERNLQSQCLIVEEPLSIRVAGSPYSVVMRTPGDEVAHAAGFCLAEGLVESPEDIVTIGFCEENDTNVATVTLTDERRRRIPELLKRKGFISQTSCGICGKEILADIQQILLPVLHNTVFELDRIMACIDSLPLRQHLYEKTESAHAAAIFDKDMNQMTSAEDVGRHNALDKAIGKSFMERRITEACFGIMTSRLSYELVQKAARAGLEMLVGISMPTALAVELADLTSMTLACAKDGRLMIFCGDERISQKKDTKQPK